MRLRIGIIIALLFLLIGFASIVWTPYPVSSADVTVSSQGPSLAHPFGTDVLGRDVLSLSMKGILTSFVVAAVAIVNGAVLGLPLGWLMARGGLAEFTGLGVMQFSGLFPALILALLLGTALGPSSATAMLAIGLSNVPQLARATRAALGTLEQADFVAAGRLAGFSGWDLLRRHMLPDLLPALGREAAALLATGIAAEAALSFVGLGAQAPAASLGLVLRDAQTTLASSPVAAVMPGLALVVMVVALGLVARQLGGERAGA